MKSRFTLAATIILAIVSLAGCGRIAANGPRSLNAIAGQKGTSPISADAFRFVVMADRTAWLEPGKWAQAVKEINCLKPDLVMCVGDFVRGYSEDPAELASEWADFEEEHRGLEAPFFYTPGNHDTIGVEPRRAYEQRHARNGKTFYAFSYRNCRFIVLDTTPLSPVESSSKAHKIMDFKRQNEIAAAQWTWLRRELQTANAFSRHVFIFGHHPYWQYPEAWATMRPMLDASKTSLFAGHTHRLFYVEKDGVPCHTLAITASRSSNNVRSGNFQMFSVVSVDAGKPTVAHLALGSVYPHDYITPGTQGAMAKVMNNATLTGVLEHGGESVLTLVNESDADVEYRLRWTGLLAPKEPQTITVPAGQKLARKLTIDAGTAAARAHLLLEATVTIDGKPRKLTRDLPLAVIGEHHATRVNRVVVDGDLADLAAAKGPRVGPADVSLGYDDANFYLGFNVSDDRIIAEGKNAWENDGVEVFWDSRPLAEAGKFEGPARQLLASILPDGSKLELETNPADDKAVLSAVKTGCRKTPDGYAIEMAIPLATLSPELRGNPEGKTIRMDVYVNAKLTPERPVEPSSLSGGAASNQRTGHYVLVRFGK